MHAWCDLRRQKEGQTNSSMFVHIWDHGVDPTMNMMLPLEIERNAAYGVLFKASVNILAYPILVPLLHILFVPLSQNYTRTLH